MTTYKGIKGLGIQNITSDAISSQIGGGTWASGNDINDARRDTGSAGTQTSNLLFGGDTPSTTTNVESYNGTSWSETC